MNNKKNLLKIIIILMPIVILISLYFFKDFAFYISNKFPKCIFYTKFNLYCPACGNTRCVLSLLRGDILSALKYNLTPVFLCILLICLYIEVFTYVFGFYKQILPRNYKFWTFIIGFFILYYIIRNFIPSYI